MSIVSLPIHHLQQGKLLAQHDFLAEEQAIALVYNGISHVVLMATPQNLAELALGFSLSEGILHTPQQLYDIEVQTSCEGWSVHLEIASSRFAALKERRRHMSGRTGCGLCGIDSLAAMMPTLPIVSHRQPIQATHIANALAEFHHRQPLRQQTGSLHGAAWVEAGNIVAVFEDVGRHNALDKLLGYLAQQNIDKTAGWILVSSRASYEMVAKAAQLGIGCLVAVSAATALAVRVAEQTNLTLIGFAHPQRQTIYTHSHYIQPE